MRLGISATHLFRPRWRCLLVVCAVCGALLAYAVPAHADSPRYLCMPQSDGSLRCHDWQTKTVWYCTQNSSGQWNCVYFGGPDPEPGDDQAIEDWLAGGAGAAAIAYIINNNALPSGQASAQLQYDQSYPDANSISPYWLNPTAGYTFAVSTIQSSADYSYGVVDYQQSTVCGSSDCFLPGGSNIDGPADVFIVNANGQEVYATAENERVFESCG
jgi:hypothetical protein